MTVTCLCKLCEVTVIYIMSKRERRRSPTRNLIVALATLVVFAIAAAGGSSTPELQKADCTTQSCLQQSCCGGCDTACK
jgi:hypothetical protein